ncbi:MAG: hypothetical protein ACP5D9_15715 [Mariniphaga sp.]
MKNLVRPFLLLALIAGLIYSCQKDNFEETEIIIPKITNAKVLDNIESVYNPVSIKEYTYNAFDADDENINKQLLDIAIAACEYFKDNSQNEFIMSRANLSSNKCFNLNELASVNSLKSANEKYVNLISAINNADLKHKSTNPLKSGVIEEYVPAIHIVNLETADMDKQPLICPGFEVNSEIEGLEDYEDYIVAMYYDENDSLKEILINEKMAMGTTHPVFVIENSKEESFDIKSYTAVQNIDIILKSATPNGNIKNNEFMINERYEGSGKSEFCITAALITESGEAKYILEGESKRYIEIMSVPKDGMGAYFGYPSILICSDDIEPINDNYIFWNTYERDWYSSKKSLGRATKNNRTIDLWGKRKYSHEWYAINPANLEQNPMDLNAIVNYDVKTYSNSKSYIKFYFYNFY